MMTSIFLTLMLAATAQQDFTQFTYCRDASSASNFETLCVQLDPNGVGEARFKRRDDDDIRLRIELSPGGKTQFLNVLAGTKYLANSANYESKRKVADLGRKHLTLMSSAGQREATFNYSEIKEVSALVTFFEGLITQETLVIDLQWAAQFDRLGIPERLDQLEKYLSGGRISDPKSLTSALDIIVGDDRILNYARTHARDLKEKIIAAK
jgi:hypothetical protein